MAAGFLMQLLHSSLLLLKEGFHDENRKEQAIISQYSGGVHAAGNVSVRVRQRRGRKGQEQSQGQPVEQTCAAKIGETEYSTLAGAIYDANSDVTIVMLRDVTENITIDKSLTLDLGTFTLSGDGDAEAAVVTISGDKPQVTVKNGTVTGGRNPQDGGGFAASASGAST